MAVKNLPEGWLTGPEAKELRRLAAGRWVLELGAYKGRSTVVLAEVAAHVISVDRHQGVEGHDPDSLPDYLTNVRHLGNVTIVIGDFSIVEQFDSHSISMVYIDGDHDYDAVSRDVELAAVITNPEIIAFHDWDFDDVREAGSDYFGRSPDAVQGSVASFWL